MHTDEEEVCRKMVSMRDDNDMVYIMNRYWRTVGHTYFREVLDRDVREVNEKVNESAERTVCIFTDGQAREAVEHMVSARYRLADVDRFRLLMKHYYASVIYYTPLMQQDGQFVSKKADAILEWIHTKYGLDTYTSEPLIDRVLSTMQVEGVSLDPSESLAEEGETINQIDVGREVDLESEAGRGRDVTAEDTRKMVSFLYARIIELEYTQIHESIQHTEGCVTIDGTVYYTTQYDNSICREKVYLEKEFVDGITERYGKQKGVPMCTSGVAVMCHHCRKRCQVDEVLTCSSKLEGTSAIDGIRRLVMGIRDSLYGECGRSLCLECINTIYRVYLNPFGGFVCPMCSDSCCCSRCNRRDSILKLSGVFEQMGGDMYMLMRHSPINLLAFRVMSNNCIQSQETHSNNTKGRYKKTMDIIKCVTRREILKRKMLENQISAFYNTFA